MRDDSHCELPKRLENYLGALSKLYAQEGNREFQEIIVNAQTRLHVGWDYDNWNGGTYGHALYLVLPDSLFIPTVKKRSEIQDQIRSDLNDIHNVQNESFSAVFLEMEATADHDWRQESGLKVTGTRIVSPASAKRVWSDTGFRLFLSHKSEVKKETAALKERLNLFGVSAFVAHNDIHPTKAWQDEIENALATMDAFAALMTKNFHESDWTDQEVGFALARGVPIIAVRLERNPYGFLGKFQALPSTWDAAAGDIVKLLVKHERMFSAYVKALHECPNFDTGNLLSTILPSIERLSAQQVDELVAAYNANSELRGSFGFSGTKPFTWGDGLVPHLHRLGPRRFKVDPNWPRLIEPTTAVSTRQSVKSDFD